MLASPLSCQPGEPRACACAGPAGSADMGTQLCNVDGASYGACGGCPSHGAAGVGGMPVAGTGQPAAGAGGGAGANGSSSGGAAGEPPLTGGSGGAGSVPEPQVDAGTGTTPDAIVAAPGTACGVGLVSLCALETEKCCVRDLSPATCIAATEPCTCDLPGCSVMDTYCDGSEDCPMGQVCCGTLDGGSAYVSFECASTCATQQNQRQACHAGETPCPSGLICANSQLLTNVQVCIDPATIEQ